MSDDSNRKRDTWTTRINVRPGSKAAIQQIAADERVSVATAIGNAIDSYVAPKRSPAPAYLCVRPHEVDTYEKLGWATFDMASPIVGFITLEWRGQGEPVKPILTPRSSK